MLTRPVTVLLNEGGGSFAVASLYGCPLGFFCTSAHSPDVAIDGGGNSIVVFTLDGRLKAFMRPMGGSYAELAVATDEGGKRSAPERARFTIVR